MRKREKGITLVTLVVTIIILLILAGVTITLLLGDNGILNRAKQSGEEYTKAQIKEEMELGILDIQTELSQRKPPEDLTKQAIIDNLADRLNNTFTIVDTLEGEYKGYHYYIDEQYVVHIGDRANGIMTLDAKVEKIGTSYFTISATATSTKGNIVGYQYIIDGVGKEQTTDNSYTEKGVAEKSEHTAKVIAIDEKGNKRESRVFTITTEPKTYLYKEGEYSPIVEDWVYGGYVSSTTGNTFNKQDKYFSIKVGKMYTAYFARSAEQVDFTEYTKLCVDVTMTGVSSASSHLFLSTRSNYANVDDWRGDIGAESVFQYPGVKYMEIDVTNINRSAYIFFRVTQQGEFNIYNVWLEK